MFQIISHIIMTPLSVLLFYLVLLQYGVWLGQRERKNGLRYLPLFWVFLAYSLLQSFARFTAFWIYSQLASDLYSICFGPFCLSQLFGTLHMISDSQFMNDFFLSKNIYSFRDVHFYVVVSSLIASEQMVSNVASCLPVYSPLQLLFILDFFVLDKVFDVLA